LPLLVDTEETNFRCTLLTTLRYVYFEWSGNTAVAAPARCSWQGKVRSLAASGRAVNISM